MHVDNNFHRGPCPVEGQKNLSFVHISEPKIHISLHTILISYNQSQPAKKLDNSNEMGRLDANQIFSIVRETTYTQQLY
jgi:hypothetical protein